MLTAICLAWCLTDCAAISWDPVPDLDVTAYVVRVQGVELYRGPALQYALPPLSEPTEFNVVAVDAAGQESVTARRLWVDPADPSTFMSVDCASEDCRQYVCGEFP